MAAAACSHVWISVHQGVPVVAGMDSSTASRYAGIASGGTAWAVSTHQLHPTVSGVTCMRGCTGVSRACQPPSLQSLHCLVTQLLPLSRLQILNKMGIRAAFGQADFSKASADPLVLTNVLHSVSTILSYCMAARCAPQLLLTSIEQGSCAMHMCLQSHL